MYIRIDTHYNVTCIDVYIYLVRVVSVHQHPPVYLLNFYILTIYETNHEAAWEYIHVRTCTCMSLFLPFTHSLSIPSCWLFFPFSDSDFGSIQLLYLLNDGFHNNTILTVITVVLWFVILILTQSILINMFLNNKGIYYVGWRQCLHGVVLTLHVILFL